MWRSVAYDFVLFSLLSTAVGKNALLLIGDDAGLEMRAYGNAVIRTPHLDRLADQAMVFHNAYGASSSCSPSRSSILTGLPSHQNGMYGLHQNEHHFNCFDSVQSLPNILHQNGIATGLIGKKHVGPASVFAFDYERSEETESILQVGRNITLMKNYVDEFLALVAKDRPFVLYVAFHDAHRCGHENRQFGSFCEKFGDGKTTQNGRIPDWTPQYYDVNNVVVPYFVQDTPQARQDIADQYTTISRLDQGVGLMLDALRSRQLLEQTLILYTSDNAIPFLNGRTNLYDSGLRVPFVLSCQHCAIGENYGHLATHFDILPTVLDWFGVAYHPTAILPNQNAALLTGQSLLPLLQRHTSSGRHIQPIKPPVHRPASHAANERSLADEPAAYASQSYHEITMCYPMRSIRSKKFRLIHNMNYGAAFGIDEDFYVSRTFQDLLNRTLRGEYPKGYVRLGEYYRRDEWQLFAVETDREERHNLAYDRHYRRTVRRLALQLNGWQRATNDPWLCAPHGVLETVRLGTVNVSEPVCAPLFN